MDLHVFTIQTPKWQASSCRFYQDIIYAFSCMTIICYIFKVSKYLSPELVSNQYKYRYIRICNVQNLMPASSEPT